MLREPKAHQAAPSVSLTPVTRPDLPESEELIKPHRSAKLKLLEGGEEDVESDPSLRNADRFAGVTEKSRLGGNGVGQIQVASAELPKNPFATVVALEKGCRRRRRRLLAAARQAEPTGPGPSRRLRPSRAASSYRLPPLASRGPRRRPADFRATLELGATSPDLRASQLGPTPAVTVSAEACGRSGGADAKSRHPVFEGPSLGGSEFELGGRMPTRPPAVVPTWKWPGLVQVTATAPVAQLVSPPLQSRNLPEPTDDAPSAAARASLVAAFLSPPFAYRNTLADLSTRVQRTSPAVEVGAYSWQPGMAHGIAETVKLADEPVRDPFSTAREKEVLGSPLVTRARAPSALASPPPSGTLRCRATLGSLVARQRNAGSLPCLSRSSVSNTCNQAHVKESATDAVRVRIQPPKYWVQAAPVVDASEQSLRPSWSQKLAPGRRSLLPSSVCWDCSVIPRVHMHASPPVRVILGQADAGLQG
ncbi:unnamed protein product [Symbiodinium necroappetens]|uniref:Uncharacterized protein n=1 Tax=Symbiodinium necroappetens TaxID=1628268 RepID=A0A812L5T2_9DINO|nr:unnamed protein product [Symbiodinium necroappetens]